MKQRELKHRKKKLLREMKVQNETYFKVFAMHYS